MTEKWLSVRKYANYKNVSLPCIYSKIKRGIIKKEDIREVKIRTRLEIKVKDEAET